MTRLARRLAIITGVSHAKGIGAAICRQFAREGATICFSYWGATEQWPSQFKQEIEALGVRCESIEVDLAKETAPTLLFNYISEQFPEEASVLVNNAAHSTRDGYEVLSSERLDAHYTVNVRATCLLSVEFARRIQASQQSSGRIINMTSGQAQGPMLGELAYATSKGAISAFTLSLSAEVAPLGITVNAVNPGPTDTGWMTDNIKAKIAPQFLLGRVGMPEDAAHLVTFLASDEASWITGQTIDSEGGFLRQ